MGVGEHSEVMDEIEKQLEEMAKYEDHLEILDKYFNEYQTSIDLAEDQVQDVANVYYLRPYCGWCERAKFIVFRKY